MLVVGGWWLVVGGWWLVVGGGWRDGGCYVGSVFGVFVDSKMHPPSERLHAASPPPHVDHWLPAVGVMVMV